MCAVTAVDFLAHNFRTRYFKNASSQQRNRIITIIIASTMESALVSAGLQPPSSSLPRTTTKHSGYSVRSVRKPLATRDQNRWTSNRKPSPPKAIVVRKSTFSSDSDDDDDGGALIKGSYAGRVKNHEIVPLVAKTKTLDELQKQLSHLQKELAVYKTETNKTMETELLDRFEGIKKHEVMTQFACKWFGILMVAHAFFYYCYFIVRKSSQASVDDDEVRSTRTVASEGILQVSWYSVSYLFIVLFDIFWHVVTPDRVRCERTTAQTHVIVAAHRAHESLEVMLPTVLRNFAPDCVWVADNGFRDKDAEALCKRLGVNYEYNEAGNKANALVVVARKIKRQNGDAIKNVVLLDDDTELGDDFFVRHDLLAKPRVGGYCVGIAINRQPPTNVWEIAIDFEYRAISHAFGARATCSTMPFCHGICAVYKLDLMIEMYSKNWSLPGGLPFGEDGYAGLDYRKAGYNLLQDNANVVLTYCPRRFFPPMFTNGRVQGYGASSLWKQRACRWFLSWPRQLPSELWLLVTYNAGSWYGNIQYRIYFFWWLFLNCVSVGWIPYMFYVWVKHESWILVLLLKAMLTATGIVVAIVRILSFPPKLRKGIHPAAPLCSPILGMANSILRFFGFLFALYWYIPFFRINKIRVSGDIGETRVEHGVHVEEPSETETTATQEYVAIDLQGEGEDQSIEVSRSWMELLSENLARYDSSPSDEESGDVPSLASDSSSSSSGERLEI